MTAGDRVTMAHGPHQAMVGEVIAVELPAPQRRALVRWDDGSSTFVYVTALRSVVEDGPSAGLVC